MGVGVVLLSLLGLCLIAGVVVTFVVWRQREPPSGFGSVGEEFGHTSFQREQSPSPTTAPSPFLIQTGEDAHESLTDSSIHEAELSEDEVEVAGVLGKGNFGTVYRGTLRGEVVAVKRLNAAVRGEDEVEVAGVLGKGNFGTVYRVTLRGEVVAVKRLSAAVRGEDEVEVAGVLGKGNFGTVYRGTLRGEVVAVKRLSAAVRGEDEVEVAGVLGKGNFGTVYRGTLRGEVVAVKRLNAAIRGEDEVEVAGVLGKGNFGTVYRVTLRGEVVAVKRLSAAVRGEDEVEVAGVLGKGNFGTVYRGTLRGEVVAVKRLNAAVRGEDEVEVAGVLGKGNFGTVYRGTLRGEVVAVKRLNAAVRGEDEVEVAGVLGKGNFGTVYRGTLRGEVVAVKRLNAAVRGERLSEADYQAFHQEIIVSREVGLKHFFIVKFLGYNLSRENPFLVLEYCDRGKLRDRLTEFKAAVGKNLREAEFVFYQLLKFARQISIGMEYLASKGYVHVDLAARNILLKSGEEAEEVRICDFGLTRRVGEGGGAHIDVPRMPIKWMPPEALTRAEFSEQSDVWAFGVTLWEMFTLGQMPYKGRTDADSAILLGKELEAGLRLPRPCTLPDYLPLTEVYNVMSDCWGVPASCRPPFRDLRSRLDVLLQHGTGASYLSVRDAASQASREGSSDVNSVSVIELASA